MTDPDRSARARTASPDPRRRDRYARELRKCAPELPVEIARRLADLMCNDHRGKCEGHLFEMAFGIIGVLGYSVIDPMPDGIDKDAPWRVDEMPFPEALRE